MFHSQGFWRGSASAAVLIGITLGWQSTARAALVTHFDPNDTSTMFTDPGSGGGTVPLTELGQNAAFVTDVRSPTPGAPLDGFVDGENTATGSPTAVFHPTLGSVFNFNGGQKLLTTNNDRANQDGFGTNVDTNTMTLVVAGRLGSGPTGDSYLLDIRDDAGDLNNANNGFGLRYDFSSGMLEGVAKQAVNASVPLIANEWFVATYAWDGANSTATLSVETLAGTNADTTVAESLALEADRWRVGAAANNSQLFVGDMGDFMLYNDVDDHSAVAAQLADDYLIPLPSLLIDRDTGNISIDVPAGAPSITNIAGYYMTSEAGTLDPNSWLSIAANYDAGSPGPNQVDPDNNWTELSNSALRSDLSELEFEQNGGVNNGADFVPGSSTNLGDAWIPYYTEDVAMLLVLDDGSTQPLSVRFTGNGDQSFEFGDLDFDGAIDEDDFHNVFVPNYGADTSSLAGGPDMYALGDLNESGMVTLEDFVLLNNAFLAANPGAAGLTFATVPEPATVSLIVIAGALLLWGSRRIKETTGMTSLGYNLAAAAVLFAVMGASAQADIVAHWSFDESAGANVLVDSVSGLNGTANNGVTGGAAGQIGGAWLFDQPTQHFVDLTSHVSNFGTLAQGTISTWFKRPAAGGASVLVSAYDDTVGSTEGRFFFENSDLRWDVRDAGGGLPDEGGQINAGDQSDDAWHHGAITIDAGQNAILYVDGAVAATGLEPFWGGMVSTLNGMAIGRNVDSGGGQWYFNGAIDDMQIYDNPLPGPAIAAIYNAGLAGQSIEVADTKLSLQANTNSGLLTLNNDTILDFEIDAYRITGPASSLIPANWNSLDEMSFDGDKWTMLGETETELSEGEFGGSSVLAMGMSPINLGNAFNTAVDVNELTFEYHLAGTSETAFIAGIIEPADSVPGDYNNSGLVEQGDLDLVLLNWGKEWPPVVDDWVNDQPTDGKIDQNDLDGVLLNWGNTATASAQSVPEPSAGLLSLIILTLVGLFVRRGRGRQPVALAIVVMMLLPLVGVSSADVSNDRDYTLGDDPAEASVANAGVGGTTFDSAGTPSAGDLQDLVVTGSPVYRAVDGPNGRPGASTGDLGIEFNGTSDRLITTISMNIPSEMWDNTTFFPLDNFPHNYEGIMSHGIQLWAKPDAAALAAGSRQDVVIDTPENGIFVSDSGTWGLQFDGGGDSGVSVADTLNGDGWAHVMQVGGLVDPVSGRSRNQGALYVNGVAVIATTTGQNFDSNATELSIASNQAGDANFYTGTLDDVSIFFWGDNTGEDSGDGRLGKDWGSLNLGEDNDWIAQKLAEMNVTELADVNLDGAVSGDGTGDPASDDVSALIDSWQSRQEVGGVLVGDWNSRQQGDINYDGVTDMFDAIMLRDALISSGGGSFDFSLLAGAAVPEPSTVSLALLAVLGLLGRRLRRGR